MTMCQTSQRWTLIWKFFSSHSWFFDSHVHPACPIPCISNTKQFNFWQISTRLVEQSTGRNFHKYSRILFLFSLSRSTPNGPITTWSVPSRNELLPICQVRITAASCMSTSSTLSRTFNLQQIAAMDYCSRTSSRLSPIFVYLIW